MNELSTRIPTNIISGFLGVGKTTTINGLLANKPEGESWAVLVNEFGQVGIDQEMMPTEEGLHVKELAGGCICCAMGASLTPTLKALIEHAKPDRLIIEPTGLGHPEGIIDTLMGPSFKDKLDLRATICILDPRSLELEEVVNNETFHDQLNLADVVMINKCDIAEAELVEMAEESLGNMFPPKQHIARTTKGALDPALLDLVRNGQLKAQFPDAHQHHHDHEHSHDDHHHHEHDVEAVAEPGQPIRKTGHGSGYYSCGWIFHREDCFEFWDLEPILNGLENIERIKGVIRIGHAWVFFNRVKDEHDFDKVAYRRDSRIEIISSKELDWDQIEQQMLGCLQK
ncbi:CobW family GTP-binding protein [Marinomonas ostreistagni]|uniref:CobW family GTP-binding protein n=1 Tax=Marinomonas ostreistagni TaxID=359209 RepID=UPI00195163F2|nr:GTP-binding protein [Marinomonas ostreistagni]MBM6550855.1 GTP-binding protein [Marinomonas ostreistagni]